MRTQWLLILCGLLLCVSACKGNHSPMPTLPSITGVTPTGNVGMPTDEIEFAAIVSNPDVMTYTLSWNFGGGATPNTTTDLEPTVELDDPDDYSGFVSLLVDAVTVMTLPFTFTVIGAPIITAVSPSTPAGLPLGVVSLVATVEGDVDTWAWELDDEGALPDTSSDESPEVTLQNPGTYTGKVTATNTFGSTEFPFDFTVAEPVAPNWRRHSLGPALIGENDRLTGVHLVLHEGKLVAFWNAPDGLRIALARNENPSQIGDWQQYVLQTNCGVAGYSGVVSVDGKLVVIYFERSPVGGSSTVVALRIAVSNHSAPTSAGDFTIYDYARSTSLVSRTAALLAFDDRLALVDANIGPRLLSYRESTGLVPTSMEDWGERTWVTGDAGFGPAAIAPRLVLEGGVPLLSMLKNGIQVCQATAGHPTDETDWDVFLAETDASFQRADSSAAILDGQLSVVFNQNSTGGVRLILATTTASPPAFGAFTYHDLQEPFTSSFGALLVNNANRVGVIYQDFTNRRLMWARQVVANQLPSSLAPWQRAIIDQDGDVGGAHAAVALPDGRLAAAYTSASGNELLISISDGVF